MNKIIVKDQAEINQAAREFLSRTEPKQVFAFYGQMGVGKTTFIKAICDEMKVIDPVSSPTFAIVNEYLTESNDAVFHFDFYRLKNAKEAQEIGAEDYFFCGETCLIEWPEVVEEMLPNEYTRVDITENQKGEREITF